MPLPPLCVWTEIPQPFCPHCTGDLSIFRVVCCHGAEALTCELCFTHAPREDRGIRPERHTAVTMQMGAFRIREGGDHVVVVGPCPACQAWQFDYTQDVANEFMVMRADAVDAGPWMDVIEEVLAEHLRECRHLQLLLEHEG